MANKPPQNLRRGIGLIGGDVVDRLNKIDPGLGSLLVRSVNQKIAVLSSRIDAAAGHKGSVHIAPQGKDVTGKTNPAIVLGSQRAGGMADPIDNEDGVNLRYFRRFLNCDWFEKMFDECIEDDSVRASAGIMPYFFGWTVHIPPEADTLVIDPFTGSNMTLWSFVLPASATVARVSFYLVEVASTFSPGQEMNIGLYDADFNLVLETGAFVVRSDTDPTVTKDGAYTIELDQEYDLEAGEYFLAFSSAACIRMVGISTTVWSITLLDHAEVQDDGLLTPGPYGLRMFDFNPTDPTPYQAFPETLGTDTGVFLTQYELRVDVPMVLFEGVKAHYG